mgnify:CR=1 FL=1
MKPFDFKQLDSSTPIGALSGAVGRLFGRHSVRVVGQILLVALVLGAGFLGYSWLLANRQPIFQRPAQEQVWAVRTIAAEISTHNPTLRVYGETRAARSVEMRALVPGEIVAIGENFREGGEVKRGELLVAVDDFPYRGAVTEAEANLREAEARLRETEAATAAERDALKRAEEQLVLARRDLERAEALSGSGAVSDKAIDDRRLIVSQREQAVEQRRNALVTEEARSDQQRAVISRLQWRLDDARRNLENTELRAPFDAYVQGVQAQIGRMVGASDVVAALLDANQTEVALSLTDRQFGRIIADGEAVIGRPVEVLWHLGSVTTRYDGRIERIAARFKTDSGGVDVFARIDTAGRQAPLRPGAFVELRLADTAYRNAVRLPETALYGTDTVYVVRDGRLESRKVELLGHDGGDIFVAGGLKGGEQVAVTRISEIGDGLLVEEMN